MLENWAPSGVGILNEQRWKIAEKLVALVTIRTKKQKKKKKKKKKKKHRETYI
jgi:hypothetical protein